MIVFPFVKGTGAGCKELRVTRGTATSQNLQIMNFRQAALKCRAGFTLKVLSLLAAAAPSTGRQMGFYFSRHQFILQ